MSAQAHVEANKLTLDSNHRLLTVPPLNLSSLALNICLPLPIKVLSDSSSFQVTSRYFLSDCRLRYNNDGRLLSSMTSEESSMWTFRESSFKGHPTGCFGRRGRGETWGFEIGFEGELDMPSSIGPGFPRTNHIDGRWISVLIPL